MDLPSAASQRAGKPTRITSGFMLPGEVLSQIKTFIKIKKPIIPYFFLPPQQGHHKGQCLIFCVQCLDIDFLL